MYAFLLVISPFILYKLYQINYSLLFAYFYSKIISLKDSKETYQIIKINDLSYLVLNKSIYIFDSNKMNKEYVIDCIKQSKKTFSQYFEITINNMDYTSVFHQYHIDFNKHILGYPIKACDIIDIETKNSIMKPNDILRIQTMDFEEYYYKYNDVIN